MVQRAHEGATRFDPGRDAWAWVSIIGIALTILVGASEGWGDDT